MAEAVHVSTTVLFLTVIRIPIPMPVAGIDDLVHPCVGIPAAQRQRHAANDLIIQFKCGAAVFDVHTGFEWILVAANLSWPAAAKQVVGRAIFLHDDDDVFERLGWNGLSRCWDCYRERYQNQKTLCCEFHGGVPPRGDAEFWGQHQGLAVIGKETESQSQGL